PHSLHRPIRLRNAGNLDHGRKRRRRRPIADITPLILRPYLTYWRLTVVAGGAIASAGFSRLGLVAGGFADGAAVAAAAFGVVEGGVHHGEPLVGIDAGAAAGADDPDGHGDLTVRMASPGEGGEPVADAVADAHGVGGGGLGHDDGDLFAAEAAGDIALAQLLLQQFGDALKHGVAGGM